MGWRLLGGQTAWGHGCHPEWLGICPQGSGSHRGLRVGDSGTLGRAVEDGVEGVGAVQEAVTSVTVRGCEPELGQWQAG